ncbi:hypothetical protein C0991_005573 [Blastosporella zonata]|nr:hypothetical protein C0991_005573 [Blastosporella zonata]
MSSRPEHRRRDRSWDREDRDRRASPRRDRVEDSARRDESDRSSQKATLPKNVSDETGEPITSRPNLDPDAPDEGEVMDAENDDDAAMMAMMGLAGFGSTKGKAVEGNQEGAVDVKKQRTWRQYMNRRGGFNRPLDKIK